MSTTCGLCARPIAPKERYRRFRASVEGVTMQRIGHVACIRAMGDAPPDQMWEEYFSARTAGQDMPPARNGATMPEEAQDG